MNNPNENTVKQVGKLTDLREFNRIFEPIGFKREMLRLMPTNPATLGKRLED